MNSINIEEEKILIGDAWKSAGTLKEEIKGKIEIGNFDITDEALALRELTDTMKDYTKIEIKLPSNFIAFSQTYAGEKGISFEEYLRGVLLKSADDEEKEEEEEVEEKKEEKIPEDAEEDEEEKVEEEEIKEEEQVEEKAEEAEAEAKPDWENEEEEEKEEKKEEKAEPKVVKVRCHSCKRPITITSPERPITVTCPNCGAKGRLEQ